MSSLMPWLMMVQLQALTKQPAGVNAVAKLFLKDYLHSILSCHLGVCLMWKAIPCSS